MGGEKSKPKPRLAMYGGLAGSALVLAGTTSKVTAFGNVARTKSGAQLVGNAALTTTNLDAAIKVAAPAAAGAVISIAADWIGLNRRLAKMRAPYRV